MAMVGFGDAQGLLQFEVEAAAEQIGLGGQNIGPGGAGGRLRWRRSDGGHLFESLRRRPIALWLRQTHEDFDLNAGLQRGRIGRLLLQFELLGADLDLFEIRIGQVAGLEPRLGDVLLAVHQADGFAQDADVVVSQESGDEGFADALVQGAAGVVETGPRAQNSGAAGGLAVMAFAGNFNQLADGGDGVVAAMPDAVAFDGGGVVRADRGGAEVGSGIGEFFDNEPLGGGGVEAAFCGEQIPVALEGDLFGIGERQGSGGRVAGDGLAGAEAGGGKGKKQSQPSCAQARPKKSIGGEQNHESSLKAAGVPRGGPEMEGTDWQHIICEGVL